MNGRSMVEALLSEDIGAARAREQSSFDRLAGSSAGRVVLYGAGGLGRRCLRSIRHDVEVMAFADGNPKLWGTTVEDLPVLPPEDAAQRFGKTAAFIVTIW